MVLADDVDDGQRACALGAWPRAMPASVSAVSPDCEMTSTSVFFSTGRCDSGIRCANSTSTGMWASSSMRYSPTSAACQLVPQAAMMMRSIGAQLPGVSVQVRRTARCPSRSRRPRRAFSTRARLLEDFLEHVVRIVAALGILGRQSTG